MTTHKLVPLLAVIPLFILAGTARSAEPDQDLAAAEKVLKAAKVATDGPGLLTFFRERILPDDVRGKLAANIRLLGDDNFGVREKATRDLVTAGRIALPFLRMALKNEDAEIADRAAKCIESINLSDDVTVTAAAARVLAERKPAGAAEVLLAYLPLADEQVIEDAVLDALAMVGLRDGKIDEPILKALKEKDPMRRSAAVFVLTKAGKDQHATLRGLLGDTEPRVRYQAASALIHAADKAAVPALLTLLSDGPATLAWQSEDLLCRIAGEKSPSTSLGTGDAASRRKCRQDWESWWKDNEGKIDLSKIKLEDAYLGLTLVSEHDGTGKDGMGRVYELSTDGKIRWMIDTDAGGPIDAQILPKGRVLIAEYKGRRVTERNTEGKILWQHGVNNSAVSCQRLPNGNTFIATLGELLEVTPDGKTVFSYPKDSSIYTAVKMRDGHIVYTHSSGQVIELDGKGNQVRTIAVGNMSGWGGVEPLPNGRFLVAMYTSNKVVEVEKSGKVVWELNVTTPSLATRLRNGNVLLSSADSRTLFEYDSSGKEVWKRAAEGRPFRIRRY